MPSANELFTLLNVTARENESLIDLRAFPGTPLEPFWSATPWITDPSVSWYLDFGSDELAFAFDMAMDPTIELRVRSASR